MTDLLIIWRTLCGALQPIVFPVLLALSLSLSRPSPSPSFHAHRTQDSGVARLPGIVLLN